MPACRSRTDRLRDRYKWGVKPIKCERWSFHRGERYTHFISGTITQTEEPNGGRQSGVVQLVRRDFCIKERECDPGGAISRVLSHMEL
jgi:hypothetical protein